MKQLKEMFKIKLKLKLLSYNLLAFITILIILGIAYLNDRTIEMIFTIVLFYIFRSMYEKQYHSKSLMTCSLISIIVFYFISNLSMDIQSSILFSVILTYLMTTSSFYIRDYLDIKFPSKKKKNSNRKIIIDILGQDNLSEECIEMHCNKIGLINISETIYLFLNNTLEDTAEILGVDNSTITRRINKFIKESKKL